MLCPRRKGYTIIRAYVRILSGQWSSITRTQGYPTNQSIYQFSLRLMVKYFQLTQPQLEYLPPKEHLGYSSIKRACGHRNHNLQTSNQRGCPKDSPWEAQVRLPDGERKQISR